MVRHWMPTPATSYRAKYLEPRPKAVVDIKDCRDKQSRRLSDDPCNIPVKTQVNSKKDGHGTTNNSWGKEKYTVMFVNERCKLH